MGMNKKFKPGDRVVVWIARGYDVYAGDTGTVIEIRPDYRSTESCYIDVIFDTGVRLDNCSSRDFELEGDFDPDIPF
jgi:hypothetical protein